MRKHWWIFLSVLLFLLMNGGAYAQEERPEIWRSEEGELVLSFAGDCTLGTMPPLTASKRSYIRTIEEKGYDWVFSGVLPYFLGDDMTLVNLEGALTDSERAVNKTFTFRGPKSYADMLVNGSIEAVNLANNHSKDFKDAGYEDTQQALQDRGIVYVDKGAPVLTEVKGVKIALFGLCSPRESTIDLLIAQMEAAKAQGAQLLIVSLHWGSEMRYRQSGDQQRWGRKLIRAGADAVIGTHPHVLQGMEWVEGGLICYSLGNFSFGGNSNPDDWDTGIVQLRFDITGQAPKMTQMRFVPCYISGVEPRQKSLQDFRPVPVTDIQEKLRILKKVGRYSNGLPDEFFETGVLYPQEYLVEEEVE